MPGRRMSQAARPITGPTEQAIRDDERSRALDDAERTMLATLITIDRRQQQQGQALLELAQAENARHAEVMARLDRMELALAALVSRVTGHPGNGSAHHASDPVDPLARTIAAEEQDR